MGVSSCTGPSGSRGVAGYNAGWGVGGGILFGSQKDSSTFTVDVKIVPLGETRSV